MPNKVEIYEEFDGEDYNGKARKEYRLIYSQVVEKLDAVRVIRAVNEIDFVDRLSQTLPIKGDAK